MMKKHTCPCCGQRTLHGSGSYEVCPVCHWEDDPSQSADPTLTGGANTLSLAQARANWLTTQKRPRRTTKKHWPFRKKSHLYG